jgi:hypothetical protein
MCESASAAPSVREHASGRREQPGRTRVSRLLCGRARFFDLESDHEEGRNAKASFY